MVLVYFTSVYISKACFLALIPFAVYKFKPKWVPLGNCFLVEGYILHKVIRIPRNFMMIKDQRIEF